MSTCVIRILVADHPILSVAVAVGGEPRRMGRRLARFLNELKIDTTPAKVAERIARMLRVGQGMACVATPGMAHAADYTYKITVSPGSHFGLGCFLVHRRGTKSREVELVRHGYHRIFHAVNLG